MNIMEQQLPRDIKVIIGLGNPGPRFRHQRHNIGFRIVDALAQRYGATWQTKGQMECANIMIHDTNIILIKPQTFMNSSGKIIPALLKKGIKPEHMLVVHDELELPFGKIKFKIGGSHRGHNGLRSIIGVCGSDFARLRFGIARPEHKEQVPDYVLSNFDQTEAQVAEGIENAVDMIEQLFVKEESE